MGAAASTKLNALLGLRLKKTELPEELQGYFEYNGKKSVEEIIKVVISLSKSSFKTIVEYKYFIELFYEILIIFFHL
jgi:hypothetical protein